MVFKRVGTIAAALAAGLIVSTGCANDSNKAGHMASAIGSSRAGRTCGGDHLGAHAIRFRTRDGVTLAGAVVGSGPVGAVLIHEYPLDLCGWWPYARYLAHHGAHVLLFDVRCFGRSECGGGRGH